MNVISPEKKAEIEDLLSRGHGVRNTAKLARAGSATVLRISRTMEYLYYCPILQLSSVKEPCEVNLARAKKVKEKGKRLSFTFEKCLECSGRRLEKKGLQDPNEQRTAAAPIPDTIPQSEEPQAITRTQILEATEQLIAKDGVATPKSLAAFFGTYADHMHLRLNAMEKSGLIQVHRPNPRGPGRESTITLATPVSAPATESRPVAPEEPIFIGNDKEQLKPEVAAQILKKLQSEREPMETPIPAKPDEASKECKESIMENIKIDLEPEWFTNLLSAFEQKAEGILVALEKATDDKMLAQDGLEILGHTKAQETLFQFLLNTFPSYEKADGYHQTWWKMYEKMWDWSAKCME